MHNSKIKRISLAVCFALMPMAVSAAGLGKLTVISGLGEPLNAEVELSASAEELSSISAQIASADVFAEQGIERASALSGVRIEVSKRPDGVPVLHMSSSQPISDPFLDMLIQVEWSSGRLLREYTALLDPPGYGDRAGTLAPAAATTSADLPGTASGKVPGKSKSRKGAAAPVAAATETDQAGGITVQRGDTLHAIAVANQVEGVSLEQMLVGLYRANKDAFAGNNMNRLKVGKIINIPPQEELQAATQKEAVKEIRVQTADWNAYRNKLAGMVAESAPAQEAPSAQTASGKITSPAEDKSASMPAGPRDVVKLSKGEAGDVKGRLTALQEETTAREKAIKESGERVAMLEKQLQDMQKLLEIKNKSLADVQNAGKTPPPPPVAAPAPKPAEPAKVEPPKAEPAPAAEQKAELVTPPPVAEAPPPEPAKPPVKKPRKIVRPAPPSAPEPGLFDNLLGNPLLLAGGGGLLALIGGAWFYLRNKRRKGLDSFEQGILTTGGLKPNTVFGNTAGGTVDTGNTSFLTDFGQGAAAGMIDTNDVDPIAEAEVYMAYGRDVQAEEILKDAISKEPKRYELHLKLLEIFANRKDNGAFETLAGELYAALGATDPTWAKVAEMGHKLEPGNPLYADSGTHAAAAKPEPVDFDATMIQQPAVASEGVGESDFGQGGLDSALDFSLDEPAAPEAAIAAASEDSVLDFDIGELELPGAEPAGASTEFETPDLGAAADLELPMLGEESPVAVEDAASAVAESAGLDFSFELPETAAEDNVQLDAADLGIGELPSLETAEAAPADESAGLSLDLPALDTEEPASEAPALELPELELPSLEEAEPEAATEAVSLDMDVEPEAEAAHDEVALDLEFPALDSAEPEAEAVSLDIGAEAEVGSAKDEVALDIGLDMAQPEVEAVSLELPEEVPAEAEEISLDLPVDEAFGLDLDIGAESISESPAAEMAELDESLVLDVPTADEAKAESAPAEEIKATTEAASDLDFNFDIDLGESATPEASVATTAAVPDLDLSGISLDLEGGGEEITLGAANESPDVDTKLDLVTAYIDMGDQEGARELLQEVLQEGGPSQRSKAQKLLDGLG